jgi:hypothetical protein
MNLSKMKAVSNTIFRVAFFFMLSTITTSQQYQGSPSIDETPLENLYPYQAVKQRSQVLVSHMMLYPAQSNRRNSHPRRLRSTSGGQSPVKRPGSVSLNTKKPAMSPVTSSKQSYPSTSSPTNNCPSSSGRLQYFHGRVINNVNVTPILWATNVANASEVTAFYKGIVNSTYIDWLSECK